MKLAGVLLVCATSFALPARAACSPQEPESAPAAPEDTHWVGQLFQDLGLELKLFQDDAGEQSLGAHFEFDKSSVAMGEHLDLAFAAKGDFAFEESVNPENLIEASLRAEYRWIDTGIRATEVAATDGDDLLAAVGTGWIVRAGLAGGFESDQSFEQNQYTIGAFASAWISAQDHDADDRLLPVWWNVPDYAPAFVRWLTGHDSQFSPRGSFAVPAITLRWDRVDVQDNAARDAAGDESDFSRLGIEASLRTPLLRVKDEEWDLSLSYRHYLELSPSDAIEDAKLDRLEFFTAKLHLPNGFFVKYVTGQLPFDEDDGSAAEIGWSSNMPELQPLLPQ